MIILFSFEIFNNFKESLASTCENNIFFLYLQALIYNRFNGASKFPTGV